MKIKTEKITIALSKQQVELIDKFLEDNDYLDNRSQVIRYLINIFFYDDIVKNYDKWFWYIKCPLGHISIDVSAVIFA